MPVDFTGGAKAFVDLGDGGAHSPQIKLEADDNSCRWNDTLVYISICPWQTFVPTDPIPTSQLSQFTCAAGAGGTHAPAVNWPHMMVYNARLSALQGYDLQFKMQFNASGATSAGSVCVAHAGTACCGDAHPGPIFGDYIESVFSATGTCVDCTSADDPIELALLFTNFSPITPTGVTIGASGVRGRLQATWAATGDPPPSYMPDQQLVIEWTPPCPPGAGELHIALPTDHCGVNTLTYTALRNALNALGLGFTASLIGAHGTDLVVPDPSCALGGIDFCGIGSPFFACAFAGAECSGAVDN